MVVQRRVKKPHNFWKILGVILIAVCILGLVAIAAGGVYTQLF